MWWVVYFFIFIVQSVEERDRGLQSHCVNSCDGEFFVFAVEQGDSVNEYQ
ncbi:hypothetical protein GLYMA_15G096302v4 [Glycine max]|nr:hypothetical protein GLYMA_15G096302v4 [Glycine max]KAH1146424.1 hypothetical protein GYH30_041866 [Glycine max]